MTDAPTVSLPLRRLNKYRLAAPCGDDFRTMLDYADPARRTTVWREIFSEAGVAPSANLMAREELEALARVAASRDGAVGVVGRGIQTRVNAYFAFEQLDDATNRPVDISRKVFESLIRTRVPDLEVAQAIYDLSLFDARVMARVNDVARRLAQQLHSDISVISGFAGAAQCIIGSHGLDELAEIGGLPAEWSLCATTLRRKQPYIVNDALADGIQRLGPAVAYHGIRSYAGVPLITDEGVAIGACCVMRLDVASYDETHIEALERTASSLLRDLKGV